METWRLLVIWLILMVISNIITAMSFYQVGKQSKPASHKEEMEGWRKLS